MIVTPKGAEAPSPPSDARARAVAILQGASVAASQTNAAQKPQEAPVLDPNKVAPEEMSVVTSSSDSSSEQVDKDDSSVSESSTEEVKSKEVAPDDKDPASDRFAQLARKEKAARAKMVEMQAKEAAIQAREAAIAAKEAREASAKEEMSLKDRLAKDPLSVLQEMGLSYDKLTEMVLNREMPKPEEAAIAKLQAEIESIKNGQEASRKAAEEGQKRQYEHAINTLRNDAKRLVESNPDFETIKVTDSVNDVVELIEKTFNEEGTLLTVEEAAKAVEDYLLEEATKLARIKKVQQRLAPSPASKNEPTPAKSQGSSDKNPQSTKTLTNAMGATRQLSARERAILAMTGEKK